EYASYKPLNPEIECQFVCDTEQDHYQVVNMGWQQYRRIYGCVIHLDIKDGKIWIQHNTTDIDIAEKLVKLGVLRQDIVLGFQSPSVRKFTAYAVS
ncbi:MAG: XisI protein, partial [Microcystaceae cyanobacterium]